MNTTSKTKVIKKTLGCRIPESHQQQRLVYMTEADLDKFFGKMEEGDGEVGSSKNQSEVTPKSIAKQMEDKNESEI